MTSTSQKISKQKARLKRGGLQLFKEESGHVVAIFLNLLESVFWFYSNIFNKGDICGQKLF